jgi:hypothetical protein
VGGENFLMIRNFFRERLSIVRFHNPPSILLRGGPMPKHPLALCLSLSLFAACAAPVESEFDKRGDESWDESVCGVFTPPPPKVLARPPKCPTTAAPAQPQAEAVQQVIAPQAPEATQGGLDRDMVRSVIKRGMSSVQGCYERALSEQPTLKGRLVVDFSIDPEGRVFDIKPRKNDLGSVSECVSHVISRFKFPPPEGGGIFQVSYPFVFSPEQP